MSKMHFTLIAVCLMASALIIPVQSSQESFAAGGGISWTYETCHWFWEFLGLCKPGSPRTESTGNSNRLPASSASSSKPSVPSAPKSLPASRPSNSPALPSFSSFQSSQPSYPTGIGGNLMDSNRYNAAGYSPFGIDQFASCETLNALRYMIEQAQSTKRC